MEQRAVVLESALFNELTLYSEHSQEFKAICWKTPVGRAIYSTEKGPWDQRRACCQGSYEFLVLNLALTVMAKAF